MSTRAAVLKGLDERIGLSDLGYPIPRHANTLPYSLGGLTVITFLILIVSGIILAQYYNPTPQFANDSVRAMMTGIGVARIARGIHYWAAQAMVFIALLHLLRVFWSGSFKRPREVNWLVGVALLALTVGLFFSGTVLKWDQEGFEALEHNVAIGELLGGLGHWFAHAFAQNVPLLVRLYIAHVSILPGLVLILIAGHFWLVKKHGVSSPPDRGREARLPFSSHLRHLARYGLIIAGLVLILAVLLPPAAGPAPVEGIEVTKPPWPFLPLFAVENWIGVAGLLWASLALFGFLAFVPLLERSGAIVPRGRRTALLVAAALVVALIGLALLAWVTPGATHVG
ncbi:MAG TPA: cytochrome b N-terminal domain-containing protein [bacterium]